MDAQSDVNSPADIWETSSRSRSGSCSPADSTGFESCEDDPTSFQQQPQVITHDQEELEPSSEGDLPPIIDSGQSEAIEQLEARVHELEEMLTKRESNLLYNAKARQLEEAKKDNFQLKKENEKLRGVNGQLEEVQEENARLKKRLLTKDGDQRGRLEAVTEDKHKLGKRNSELQSLCDTQTAELAEIHQRRERLAEETKKHADAMKNREVGLESHVQELSSQLTSKREELDSKLNELATFQEQCDLLKADCNKLEDEKEILTIQLGDTCEALKVTTKELDEKCQDLSHSEAMFNDQHKNHTSELHKLSSELENERGKRSDVEGERNKIQTVLFEVTEEKDRLTRDLSKKQEEAQWATGSLKEIQDKLRKAENERDYYKQQRDDAWRNLTTRNNKITEMEQQAKLLDEKVQNAVSNFEKERTAREDMVHIHGELEDRIKNLDAENKRIKEENNVFVAERLRYEMELSSISSTQSFTPTGPGAGGNYHVGGAQGYPPNQQYNPNPLGQHFYTDQPPQNKICGSCGTSRLADSKFCSYCGRRTGHQ